MVDLLLAVLHTASCIAYHILISTYIFVVLTFSHVCMLQAFLVHVLILYVALVEVYSSVSVRASFAY